MVDDIEGAKRRTSERIAQVRERFAAGLGARKEALCALARTAGGTDRDAAAKATDELRLGLHNLAGGAPTLGLTALGEAAAELEKLLVMKKLPDGGLDASIADELAVAIEALPASA